MNKLQKALIEMFRQRQLKSNKSNQNIKSYRSDLRELKLEVLLFTHFMYEDDDKLSLKEKISIVNMINNEVETLPQALEDQFYEWADNPPSLGYILDFAKKNKYSYEDLDNAIRAFVHHTDSKSKYHPVIRSVRKKLLLEKEYLKK